MEQQPHCLDLGAQRMFQGSLLLVFRGQLDVASLYECHRQLLAAWPLLAMRMNLTVGDLVLKAISYVGNSSGLRQHSAHGSSHLATH